MARPARRDYLWRMAQSISLEDFVDRHRRLFVLTGAGCSVGSGIPDYRDAEGAWKRRPPVGFQAFMALETTRQRYWARSLIGWRRIRGARPNDAHRALVRLEAIGKSEILLTQNVDRLHQRAGSAAVIDLHGRLDRVRCMGCERLTPREALQDELAPAEPRLACASGGRRARRRRRSRRGRLFRVPRPLLRGLRRRAQARCRVLRRERAARSRRGGDAPSRSRPTRC